MNGVARVCEEGSEEDSDYRRQHLDNNPDYAQFIVGSNEIAVIAVELGGWWSTT